MYHVNALTGINLMNEPVDIYPSLPYDNFPGISFSTVEHNNGRYEQ